MSAAGHIASLLQEVTRGDRTAYDRLFPLVYEELKRIAHRHLNGERDGHTLNTTGLVHECYLNLCSSDGRYNDRAHFSAVASSAMRRILVDYARRRSAAKRGGGARRVDLDEAVLSVSQEAHDLLSLNDAVERLEAHDARLGRLVECRFFGGMTIEESAAALGISLRTAHRDWQRARAYLYRALVAEESSSNA